MKKEDYIILILVVAVILVVVGTIFAMGSKGDDEITNTDSINQNTTNNMTVNDTSSKDTSNENNDGYESGNAYSDTSSDGNTYYAGDDGHTVKVSESGSLDGGAHDTYDKPYPGGEEEEQT
ncbi:hypothetical protein [uncultured Methanobrevibacter sp.]|uniref:hypothetical protein n=1 Tax=uncultured Methanobrevibacter sp. TaxID=253161 RepID=UPI0025CCEE53|nr:hypothetical protein [uncultured Methanobrevibacter sp.]